MGAIIPALMHRIPSELRSYACLGESTTRMGDPLGSPCVASLFLRVRSFFFSVQLVLMWSDTRLAVVEYEDKKYDKLHEPVTSGSHNLKRAEKQ